MRSSAKLVFAGQGQYLLQINGDDTAPQYASTPLGKPFVLDLRGRPKAEMSVDQLSSGMPLP
jgi:hypothetical protein